MSIQAPCTTPRARRRYLRPPVPLHFPVEQKVPETARHAERRLVLWQSVRRELGGRALVSSDQFVYWDPTDPGKCLAPDLAVRVGAQSEQLDSWKTWERGAPHVGVEIVSASDTSERELQHKLERYRQAGIAEVVRFDADDAGRPLRLWDLVDGDLVERDPADPEARRCDALGLYWCVGSAPELGPTLRLARDGAGCDVLLTPEEAGLARIAELEAELTRQVGTRTS